jgi:hypothetical protein
VAWESRRGAPALSPCCSRPACQGGRGPAVGLFRLLAQLLRGPRRMCWLETSPEAEEEPQAVRESPVGVVLLILFVVVTLILGVYAQPWPLRRPDWPRTSPCSLRRVAAAGPTADRAVTLN